MNHVKLASDLCGIIDAQNAIILAQAMEISQLGGNPRLGEIDGQRKAYTDAMGEKETLGR